MTKEEFYKVNVFGKGNPNDKYAKYFVGNSYLNPLVDPNDSPLFLVNVTFEPLCRNNWHVAKKDSWFSHIFKFQALIQKMNG